MVIRRIHNDRATAASVELTPMVDVTFLLLIFLMLTASFQLQKSIAVADPPAQPGDPSSLLDQPAAVRLQIDHRGSSLVLTPHWTQQTIGKQQLVTALRKAAFESGLAPQLTNEVDSSANLAALVAALDAGTTAGFTTLRITESDLF